MLHLVVLNKQTMVLKHADTRFSLEIFIWRCHSAIFADCSFNKSESQDCGNPDLAFSMAPFLFFLQR
jgi:hypothetical protein